MYRWPDGPKSWTLQLDGAARATARIAQGFRVCSSTYVQLLLTGGFQCFFFSELCLVDGFNYAALFSRRNGMFV